MSLKDNVEFLRQLNKLSGLGGVNGDWTASKGDSPLIETADFGDNPGALRMLSFVPEGLSGKIPLVVVLHGCTQTATDYEIGAGWCALARRYGFAVLAPEQRRSNNPNVCFNWFSSDDIRRDSGEAGSIRAMVEAMATSHPIDRARIFVTGLSAGGAMTAVMLATYPDVFAGGAVIAGLPYGVAHNVRAGLGAMRHAPTLSSQELGALVRHATQHKGPWPKLSVWHGSADRTVDPHNADALVRQWLDLHGLTEAPTTKGKVDGQRRLQWKNSSGEIVVESYSIADMAHGTPLGVAANDHPLGVAGPYLLAAGISSSYHIAQFFGLTSRVHQPWAKPAADAAHRSEPHHAEHGTARAKPRKAATDLVKDVAYAFKRRPDGHPGSHAGKQNQQSGRGLDIGGAINRALTAAGLLK
ncbi:PHB depolymerase family esterase [Rhodopseudomonas sp. B29]|uniref:extracellular catalytic domain type 1 short-chain-length polyhydroxyalkanoate depolymerase n=1 Tax=Rhodopseudomonas sp. B29 TaxID=95607 RepID=UPI0003480FCD|nr:PHB depolymerase family esterase [Rhodopseudomonas sp. B29]